MQHAVYKHWMFVMNSMTYSRDAHNIPDSRYTMGSQGMHHAICACHYIGLLHIQCTYAHAIFPF